jgi:hypothetical protein
MTENANPSRTETDWVTLLNDNSRTGGQGIRPAHAPFKTRWQFRTGSSIRSAPILRDGILYVTCIAGSLQAIDVASGRAKWKFPVAQQVHSTPSFYGDKFCSLRRWQSVCRRLRFRRKNMGEFDWRSLTSPVAAVELFFGSADAQVYAESQRPWALDAATRRPNLFRSLCRRETNICRLWRRQGLQSGRIIRQILWSTATGNGIDSSPVVVGDTIVIGSRTSTFMPWMRLPSCPLKYKPAGSRFSGSVGDLVVGSKGPSMR